MTTILMLPILAIQAVAEILLGTTEIEQRLMENKAKAEYLMNVSR